MALTKFVIGQDRETGEWKCLGQCEWTKEPKYGRNGLASRRTGWSWRQYGYVPFDMRKSPFYRKLTVVEAQSMEELCLADR